MRTLGVILARSGSAGLRNKHLLPLGGKPVIEYTFAHAAAARRLTRIVVSSDCPLIRSLAEGAGLETIARPSHLATADASVQDVLLHALDQVEARGEWRAQVVVVLYGNVPIRPAGVIDRAIEHLVSSGCDSVRSFVPVGKWHPAWMSRLDGDRAVAVVPGSIHRRQDLEPLYLHDGAVVAVSRQSLLRGREHPEDPHAFFGADRRAIRTEPGETVEIDELKDLFLAEVILRGRQGTSAFARGDLRIAS